MSRIGVGMRNVHEHATHECNDIPAHLQHCPITAQSQTRVRRELRLHSLFLHHIAAGSQYDHVLSKSEIPFGHTSTGTTFARQKFR